MKSGVTFTKIFCSETLFQIEIAASNGVFSGVSAPYFDHDTLWKLSRALVEILDGTRNRYRIEFAESIEVPASYLIFFSEKDSKRIGIECMLHRSGGRYKEHATFFVFTDRSSITKSAKSMPELTRSREEWFIPYLPES